MQMRCHHHQMNTKFRKNQFSFTHLNLFLNFMALNFNSHSHSSSSSWLLLLLFTLLSIFHTSLIPPCLSQPTESPQNIETFYPIGAQTPSSPPPSSPELLGPPPPPPAAASVSSSKGKIWKAVAATFAATLVVSGLIFFIVQRCLRSKRRKEEVVIVPQSNNVVNNNNGFERIDGNVKGLIVDENGLDVVYWRKIQGRNPSRSLKREIFRRLAKKKDHQEGKEKEEEEGEEEEDENGRKKGKKSDIVQEYPLLRGQSSSSHMNIMPEEDDEANRITRKIPSLPTIHAPPSSTRSSGSSFVFPTNERKSREESSPARKNQAPAPPPSSTSSSSNGVVKLKPLHRDKANTSNADHKNDSGSSLRVDHEFMEALFGYVATRRSPKGKLESVSPQRDTSSSG